MADAQLESGSPVTLQELHPSSQFSKRGASLRIIAKLREYSVATAIAIVADGDTILKIDTKHIRDLHFRVGSIYQFIGELHIEPDDEAILQARTGRNVDGIDLNLYKQSIQLLRQFLQEQENRKTFESGDTSAPVK